VEGKFHNSIRRESKTENELSKINKKDKSKELGNIIKEPGFILPNLTPLNQCMEPTKHIDRKTRSINNTTKHHKPQSEQFCSGFPM